MCDSLGKIGEYMVMREWSGEDDEIADFVQDRRRKAVILSLEQQATLHPRNDPLAIGVRTFSMPTPSTVHLLHTTLRILYLFDDKGPPIPIYGLHGFPLLCGFANAS